MHSAQYHSVNSYHCFCNGGRAAQRQHLPFGFFPDLAIANYCTIELDECVHIRGDIKSSD